MCTVSNVGDNWRKRFETAPWWPYQPPYQPAPYVPAPKPNPEPVDWSKLLQPQTITRAEFDQLKKDVAEMKEMLRAAKQEDEEQGNPECEMEEKMAVLRAVSKLVGVSLDDVIPPKEAAIAGS